MTYSTIDWPLLLGDLAWLYGEPDPTNPTMLRIAIGMSTLADKLGVSRGAVRNWLDGGEPRHMDGEMLVARWVEATGKRREYLPLATAVMSAARAR